MSFKLFVWAVVSIIVYTSAPIQAGVLRSEQLIESTSTDIQNNASELPESTTNNAIVANSTATPLSSDEEAIVKNAVASLDPAPGSIEGIEISLDTVDGKKEEPKQNEEEEKESTDDGQSKEKRKCNEEAETALSRDEAASIKVSAHESADLAKELTLSSAESAPYAPKPSKLLLLSTPRLTREQEENISEPEDIDINTAVSTDETTEISIEIEIETETEKSSEVSEENDKNATADKPSFITRVHDAIFGKKSADEEAKETDVSDKKEVVKKSSDDVEKQDKEQIKKDDDAVIVAAAEQAPEPHNDNAATAVLVETEADYVLVDSDVEHLEHLGSFIHADSDEHLQPIVHSVEVVPSHFEEPLLFTSSYVHAW